MRIAEMKYCGIRHLGYSNIPFGVRAMEQGADVQGIWNSCRGTPAASQDESSATLAVKQEEIPHRSEESQQHTLDEAQTDGDTRGVSWSSIAADCPYPSSSRDLDRSAEYRRQSAEGMTARKNLTESSSIACICCGSRRVSLNGNEAGCTLWPQQLARHGQKTRTLSLDSSNGGCSASRRQFYGSAQVYVNTDHRMLNAGFEILPAGTLGNRPELPLVRNKDSATVSVKGVLQSDSLPAKLQKRRR